MAVEQKMHQKKLLKPHIKVELFDEELNKETFKFIGIKTLKPFKIRNKINLLWVK